MTFASKKSKKIKEDYLKIIHKSTVFKNSYYTYPALLMYGSTSKENYEELAKKKRQIIKEVDLEIIEGLEVADIFGTARANST